MSGQLIKEVAALCHDTKFSNTCKNSYILCNLTSYDYSRSTENNHFRTTQ